MTALDGVWHWYPIHEGNLRGWRVLHDLNTVTVWETGEWQIRGLDSSASGCAASPAIARRMLVEVYIALCNLDGQRRWPQGLHTIMREVLVRHPDVQHFLPDERLVAALLPQGEVDPMRHFPVPSDAALYALARQDITDFNARGHDLRCHAGDDAVLVVAAAF